MDKSHLLPPSRGPLWDKSFQLAIRIVRLYKYLVDEKKEHVISHQILRSGTSPGALVREAGNAESDKDFIHKLAVAQKETDETRYWLELLVVTDFISESQFQSLYSDATEVLKLVRSSILTKKKKL